MGECNTNIRYGELVKVLHETVAKLRDKADHIAKNFVPKECVRPHAEREESRDPTNNVFDAVRNELIELNELDATLDEIISVI